MPSDPDSRIEFRDIKAKTLIKELRQHPNLFAKVAVNKILELGCCPICGKSFDECPDFQKIRND